MRVLLVPYPGTESLEGGHRTQQRETAVALCEAGVDARVVDVAGALAEEADVVHFFGNPHVLLAAGRPRGRFVVSPVYWPASYRDGPMYWRGGRIAMWKHRARFLLSQRAHPDAVARRRAEGRVLIASIAQADLVVTNSHAEAALLEADAAGVLPPVRVAYSGVGAGCFGGDAAEGRRLLLGFDQPFVLCVGRIEPGKNQLSLALAMRSVPRALVLVGRVLPGNERYLAACRDVLPELVHVPHVEHRSLAHVYAAADAHVLPSWYETTGLATLEALAAGTPAVAGRGPCVEEYFSAWAELHDPGDVGGLRRSIERALSTPRGGGIERARQFSWERTARELIAAYTAGGR